MTFATSSSSEISLHLGVRKAQVLRAERRGTGVKEHARGADRHGGKVHAPTLRLAEAAPFVFPIRLAIACSPASIIPTSDAVDSSASSP